MMPVSARGDDITHSPWHVDQDEFLCVEFFLLEGEITLIMQTG